MLVDFVVDGKRFASRNWNSIPRVNDHVFLNDGNLLVKVIEVVWGDDESTANPILDKQWVQVLCKTIPNTIRGRHARNVHRQ